MSWIKTDIYHYYLEIYVSRIQFFFLLGKSARKNLINFFIVFSNRLAAQKKNSFRLQTSSNHSKWNHMKESSMEYTNNLCWPIAIWILNPEYANKRMFVVVINGALRTAVLIFHHAVFCCFLFLFWMANGKLAFSIISRIIVTNDDAQFEYWTINQIDIYRIIKRIWGKEQKTKLNKFFKRNDHYYAQNVFRDCPETWSFFREIQLFSRSKNKKDGQCGFS